jgi:hypothetical protein
MIAGSHLNLPRVAHSQEDSLKLQTGFHLSLARVFEVIKMGSRTSNLISAFHHEGLQKNSTILF